jgi:hypothetical protein
MNIKISKFIVWSLTQFINQVYEVFKNFCSKHNLNDELIEKYKELSKQKEIEYYKKIDLIKINNDKLDNLNSDLEFLKEYSKNKNDEIKKVYLYIIQKKNSEIDHILYGIKNTENERDECKREIDYFNGNIDNYNNRVIERKKLIDIAEKEILEIKQKYINSDNSDNSNDSD